jgi:hypothetical protein
LNVPTPSSENAGPGGNSAVGTSSLGFCACTSVAGASDVVVTTSDGAPGEPPAAGDFG